MRDNQSEHLERLRRAAANAFTEDDVREIFQGIVQRAKKGDPEAVKTVIAYLTPAPPKVGPVNVLNVGQRNGTGNGRQRQLIEQNGDLGADEDED